MKPFRTPGFFAAVLLMGGIHQAAAADAPLSLKESVSQYGITWTFEKKVPVGEFINGDHYVVGPVTITAIDPAPKPGRNGSQLNPPMNVRHGYDNRGENHYDAKLAAVLPIPLAPGDSLVSSISLPEDTKRVTHVYSGHNYGKDKSEAYILTAAVLTCLKEQVPVDTFRPSYSGHQARLYHFSDLHLNLLPNLEPTVVAAADMPTLEFYTRVFQRPWLDHVYSWGSRMVHPADNMPDYGREVGRAVSEASLLLECNYPLEKKKPLLVNFLQYGIDLWGIVQNGGKGWPAQGGFGNGRKWPILFAGILFQDEAMQKPKAEFDEDDHTGFGKCWTGATVVFTGQFPRMALQGAKQAPDRGAYESLSPADWPGPNKTESESYRRCCTSISYVGQALAARMMKAEKLWDHDAFFAYVDRWMYEDDTEAVKAIKAAINADMSRTFLRQGQCWDPFVEAMWQRYRKTLAAPIDDWNKPHPDAK